MNLSHLSQVSASDPDFITRLIRGILVIPNLAIFGLLVVLSFVLGKFTYRLAAIPIRLFFPRKGVDYYKKLIEPIKI